METPEIQKWFSDDGRMNPYGENGILFTAEYVLLHYVNQTLTEEHERLFHIAVAYHLSLSGKFVNNDQKWSHDNHTAIVCISKILNLHLHKEMPWSNFHCMLHPRDFIFYAWATGAWYSYIALLFLWIPSICMIFSCASSYKTRNGNKILKTDGKILNYLRFKAFKLPITAFISNIVLKCNKKFGTWKRCFEIYFTNINHPNRNFPDKVYEV